MKHNWEYKKWGDVLRIFNGKNQKAVENPIGLYPIYGSGGIMSYADDYICPENCTIIGRKGNINNPIFVPTKFWNVDTAFGLCPSELLNPRYLYYFCEIYDFERHNKATTIPSLVKNDLLKISIPVPPLSVQEQIVGELDKINELIDDCRELLRTLDNLAQSIFYDTFGDLISNPKGWEVKALKEAVIEMFLGPFGSALKTDCYVEENHAFAMVYEQKHAIKKTLELKNNFIDKDKFLSLKRFEVLPFDFIMSCRGTIGQLYQIPENSPRGIIHPSLMKIRLNKSTYIDSFFIYMLPIIIKEQQTKGNCVQMAITAKELGAKKLPVPPLTLQEEFAKRIEAIEAIKATTQQQLAALQTLLDSRMDYWFN